MRYKKLGNSSLNVSVVGQGTWALGNDFFGEVDVDLGIKAVQAAIDAGINMVDTAPGYGQHFESEIAVGKAIKGRRDKVCLATKCGIHRIAGEYVKALSPKLVRWEMEQSLKRLQTDYIDLYMIHWPDANNGIEGALEELAKMKKEGLCREVGVSNFTPEEMKIGIEIAGIVSCQPPLSLLDQRSLNNGVIAFCRGKTTSAASPTARLAAASFRASLKNPRQAARSSAWASTIVLKSRAGARRRSCFQSSAISAIRAARPSPRLPSTGCSHNRASPAR